MSSYEGDVVLVNLCLCVSRKGVALSLPCIAYYFVDFAAVLTILSGKHVYYVDNVRSTFLDRSSCIGDDYTSMILIAIELTHGKAVFVKRRNFIDDMGIVHVYDRVFVDDKLAKSLYLSVVGHTFDGVSCSGSSDVYSIRDALERILDCGQDTHLTLLGAGCIILEECLFHVCILISGNMIVP